MRISVPISFLISICCALAACKDDAPPMSGRPWLPAVSQLPMPGEFTESDTHRSDDIKPLPPEPAACTPGERFTQGKYGDIGEYVETAELRNPDSPRYDRTVSLPAGTITECVGGLADKDLVKVVTAGEADSFSESSRPNCVAGDVYLRERRDSHRLRQEAREKAERAQRDSEKQREEAHRERAKRAQMASEDAEIRRLLTTAPARPR